MVTLAYLAPQVYIDIWFLQRNKYTGYKFLFYYLYIKLFWHNFSTSKNFYVFCC